VVAALGEAGYLRLMFPDLYRGSLAKPGLTHATILSEEASAINYAFETTIATALSCAYPLHRHARPDIRDRYLGGIVDGRIVGAICVTEPQAGSDTSRLATRIEGDEIIYTVTKRFFLYNVRAGMNYAAEHEIDEYLALNVKDSELYGLFTGYLRTRGIPEESLAASRTPQYFHEFIRELARNDRKGRFAGQVRVLNSMAPQVEAGLYFDAMIAAQKLVNALKQKNAETAVSVDSTPSAGESAGVNAAPAASQVGPATGETTQIVPRAGPEENGAAGNCSSPAGPWCCSSSR
jgi:hypothetical protein